MASTKRLVANRSNARRSTGPRTVKGKAVSAQNAARHGLLSTLRVLPEVERQEDWDAHLERTIESVNPVGYLETLLAERLALLLWRLRRLATHEQAAGAINIRKAKLERSVEPESCMTRLHEVEDRARAYRDISVSDAADIQCYRRMHPSIEVDPHVAARIIRRVAHLGDVNAECPEIWELFFDDVSSVPRMEDLPWTVGTLFEALTGIENATGIEVDDALRSIADSAQAALQRVGDEIATRRGERSIMPADVLEKIQRYETGLERSVHRTLHEIERLQAHRNGGDVPVPVAIDVTVESESSAG